MGAKHEADRAPAPPSGERRARDKGRDEPRVVVDPLRPLTPEERTAVARRLAAIILRSYVRPL